LVHHRSVVRHYPGDLRQYVTDPSSAASRGRNRI
jgi:hypothetical protein